MSKLTPTNARQSRARCTSSAPSPIAHDDARRQIPFQELRADPNGPSTSAFTVHDGVADVILPGAGIFIEGQLIDCPEHDPKQGWVVIATAKGTFAAGSPNLRDLVIENYPCWLRLDSVPAEDGTASERWDWKALELSPNGGWICVSEIEETQPGTHPKPSRRNRGHGRRERRLREKQRRRRCIPHHPLHRRGNDRITGTEGLR